MHISFSKPYQYQPIVTVTPLGHAAAVYVDNVTSSGFDIKVDQSLNFDVTFDWHAFGGDDAKIFMSDGSVNNISLIVGTPVPTGGNAGGSAVSGDVLSAATSTDAQISGPDGGNASTTPAVDNPAPSQPDSQAPVAPPVDQPPVPADNSQPAPVASADTPSSNNGQ